MKFNVRPRKAPLAVGYASCALWDGTGPNSRPPVRASYLAQANGAAFDKADVPSRGLGLAANHQLNGNPAG